MSEGELRLSGDSFNNLKNTVDDLSRSATRAKNALEKLFSLQWAEQQDWITNDRIIGQMEVRFGHLNNLIDKLNTKLAITNARMSNIFGGQATQIKDIAKALGQLNRSASGGGRRGGGGGGGWWNNEGFNPFGGDGGGESGGWKANWVSSLDAAMSADKLNKTIAKARSKANSADTKSTKKAIDDYYKQQVAAEEKVAKIKLAENEQLKKAIDTYRREQVAAEEAVSKLKIKQRDDETKAWHKRLAQTRAEEQAELAFIEKSKRARLKLQQQSPIAPPFIDRQINKLVEMGRKRFYMSQVMGNNFGRAAGTYGGGGQGMLSRFGPGVLGILGRYRVFQKPFPGSERNVFALGDLASAGQNIVGGAGDTVGRSFEALTSSAFAVNRAFGGVVASAVSLIPVLGPTIGAAIGAFTDLIVGTMEKLSQAIAGVIGGLTRFATALTGFATRAVEAASSFTEAVNAANVVAGPEAARGMSAYAVRLQREFGISATDMVRGMGRIAGQLRQQGGFSPQEAGDQAREIARQVADIASVNNVPFENVMRDVMSGIVGRLTPLRKDIISMSAPSLDQYARAKGISNPALRTDYVARTRMFIEEFARQAGLFTGDLERTRYEFANQRRKFLGGFEAMFLTVGRILEPFGKAILIAANDLMDTVFDLVAPFANDPYEAFKKSIEGFAYYVIYAKNAIISLAQGVYDSRQTILEYAQYIGKQLLHLTLMLVRYSANILNMFAGLMSGLANVLPALEMFGNALISLTNFIYKLAPTTDAERLDKQTKISQMRREMALIESGKSEYNRPGMEKEKQRRMVFLSTNIAGTIQSLERSSPVKDMLLGTGTMLENTAKSLESFQGQFSEAMKSLVGNTDVSAEELKSLLARLAPVQSKANAIPPAPPLSMAGSLVRYFSPEAFRDAIQERDVVNAQLRTADATEGILELMRQGNGKTMPGTTLPRPSQFNNPLGVITLP